jgi:toxin-antitoxin system PIN domain toxin
VSFALDLDVLLYASDSTSRYRRQASSFLQACMETNDLFYVAWPTIMSYLRIATHPSVFVHPLSPDEAAQNIQTLIDLPHVRVLSEGEGFWEVYQEVTRERHVRGNHVPDAHLAALLRYHGIKTIYTHDRDFLRFEFLQVRDPLV